MVKIDQVVDKEKIIIGGPWLIFLSLLSSFSLVSWVCIP